MTLWKSNEVIAQPFVSETLNTIQDPFLRQKINLIKLWLVILTKYSLLNSCSRTESLLSSQLSSKAVRMGSLLERAMSEGLARAR